MTGPGNTFSVLLRDAANRAVFPAASDGVVVIAGGIGYLFALPASLSAQVDATYTVLTGHSLPDALCSVSASASPSSSRQALTGPDGAFVMDWSDRPFVGRELLTIDCPSPGGDRVSFTVTVPARKLWLPLLASHS